MRPYVLRQMQRHGPFCGGIKGSLLCLPQSPVTSDPRKSQCLRASGAWVTIYPLGDAIECAPVLPRGGVPFSSTQRDFAGVGPGFAPTQDSPEPRDTNSPGRYSSFIRRSHRAPCVSTQAHACAAQSVRRLSCLRRSQPKRSRRRHSGRPPTKSTEAPAR